MAIDRDRIGIWLVNNEPIIGELQPLPTNEIQINYPFRIIPDGKGNIQIAAVFMSEEWMKFDPKNISSFIELSVPEKLKDVYIKYQMETWSTIIMPGQSGLIV